MEDEGNVGDFNIRRIQDMANQILIFTMEFLISNNLGIKRSHRMHTL